MPWRSVVPMEEKIRFIGDYLNGVFSFIELCSVMESVERLDTNGSIVM